jgi:lycopene beta-cyclase
MNELQPHSAAQIDLVILGAGCAGLSLAARLAGQNIRFVIVEPRTTYLEDRTWCGWRMQPHFFADCTIHTWDTWGINGNAGNKSYTSHTYPYEMIDPHKVYEKTKKMLDDSKNGMLLLGKKATSVIEEAYHATVHLDDGTTLKSKWVVDTRPEHRELEKPWLWQNFVGYVVEIDELESSDASSNAIPTLMDFQKFDDPEAVAQFMYVLPYAEHSFLCECTRFSKTHGETELLEADLLQWLDKRYGNHWRMIRSESGSLPMAPALAHDHKRIIDAGTRGGSMRIATGYAFHRIQQWADACRNALVKGMPPIAPKSNHILNAMDEIFLRVLGAKGASAEQLFSQLFENCDTDSLLRFLCDEPRTSDLWPVIYALPWPQFINQLPAYVIAHIS